MATGREARMQQRMRGAQRHQVQEAEFDLFFDLPAGLDHPIPPPPLPAPERTTPSKSSKKRRLNDDDSAKGAADASAVAQPAAAQIARTIGSQPSQEEVGESPLLEPGSGRRRSVIAIATAAAASRTAALHQAVSATHTSSHQTNSNSPDSAAARRNSQPSPELSTMIELLPSTGQHKPKGSIFSNLPTTSGNGNGNGNDEAVDELSSPAFSPAFGVALEPADDITTASMLPSSSPLARKSTAGARAAGTRAASKLSETTQTMDQPDEPVEPDEPSPDPPVPTADTQPVRRPAQGRQASEVPSSSPVTRVAKRLPPQKTLRVKSRQNTISTVEEEPEPRPAPEQEKGEEHERSTVHEPSPELGSQLIESQPVSSPAEHTRANRRRRPRDQEQSPSAQSQPRPPKKSLAKAGRASAAKSTATAKKRQQKRKRSDDGGSGNDEDEPEGVEGAQKGSRSRGAPVPITVQRFSKMRMAAVRKSHSDNGADKADEADEADDDELAVGGDLLFTNRSGVNAVDVLAQICEDVVEQKLQQLQDKYEHVRQQAAEDGGGGAAATAAATAAVRKDMQAARRALQSFQQELRTRLLEQAVAVDTLYAMRKRVRVVHKEKLALREEILRIRAERDQVGLRMDALRAQHQQRVGQAMKTTQMSSTMFDIELAVEQGRAAPELTPAQQKTAELANLELVVRRIASQVSGGCRDMPASENGNENGNGNRGGTLNQIVEFNAFLERTAAVLEGRRLIPAKAALA